MFSPAALKQIRHSKLTLAKAKRELSECSSKQYDSGFTLIEVVVVVLMIAILAAIAAPSWFGFVQQRRVGTINDAIFRALQEAQSQAKKTKQDYSVSFRMKDGTPQIASYPTTTFVGTQDTKTDVEEESWQNLGKELQLKKDEVLLCSNLRETNAQRDNTSQNSGSMSCDLNNKERTIVFDHEGNLESGANLGANDEGLIISVAVPNPSDSTKALSGGVRCVKIKTLIGSMQTGRGKYDATNNKQGCPLP